MVPHNRPTLGVEESNAALRVIQSGMLAQGKEVRAFEDAFCAYLGLPAEHAVAVSSGSAALYLSLWILEAKGKRVAIPAYTCSALRHAVALAQAKEVLLDCAQASPNVDFEQLRRVDPDVAIVPHTFGIPSAFPSLKFPVIEDCAQAFGASVGKVRAGLQGKIGVFSFYATKPITSGGQGGMLVSRDKSIVEAIRDYRSFDLRRDKAQRFNFQMTELQAAIGYEQLLKYPKFLQRREEIFQSYAALGLDLLTALDRSVSPIRYRAVLRSQNPRKLIENLARNQVTAIVPIEDWELLGDGEEFQNASKLTRETVSLPIYPSLKSEELKAVISALKGSEELWKNQKKDAA